ncbi:MAG: YifB family Mg chelatase-like AAA ATPase [Bacteroidales bacterium]
MSLVKVHTGALLGVEAVRITVEVSVSQGIRFFIVGLADNAIRESQQRIESALVQSGFEWPHYRIVINLAPADLRKEGSHFDLPLALGILAASEAIDPEKLDAYLAVGELSLDGSVHPVRGVLPMALLARKEGFRGILVPAANGREASVVQGLDVVPLGCLNDVKAFLEGRRTEIPVLPPETSAPVRSVRDYADVRGQEAVKRAFVIAAAGNHNLLMVGSPGSGKSMMAARLPAILPPMGPEEAIQATMVHSVAGKVGPGDGLMKQRPFRAPHHTISHIAMIGGGSRPQPGEISLAHHGVLFLDELTEFKRHVLEVLRQPLEEGAVAIARAGYRVTYPADFLLVAAMNPCPCGYYNHPGKECQCGPGTIKRYLSRISGPLLDRIDLHVEIRPVSFGDMSDRPPGTGTADMATQVAMARRLQSERFQGENRPVCNARMESAHRFRHCALGAEGTRLMRHAMEAFGLSARSYEKVVKVARTIADLDGSPVIGTAHVAEALTYRTLDREIWSG